MYDFYDAEDFEFVDALKDFVDEGKLFTTIDIYNKVKTTSPNAKYKKVRKVVRDWANMDMAADGYKRIIIDVTISNNSTQAFLYFPTNANPDDYTERSQTTKSKSFADSSGFFIPPNSTSFPPYAQSTTTVSPTIKPSSTTAAPTVAPSYYVVANIVLNRENDRIRIPSNIVDKMNLCEYDNVKIKIDTNKIEIFPYDHGVSYGKLLQVTNDCRINVTDYWLNKCWGRSQNKFHVTVYSDETLAITV